jgi:hypothetical protein
MQGFRAIHMIFTRLGPRHLAFAAFCLAALGMSLALSAASAEPIRHPIAIFAGLDKTTGRIINFEVAIDETVQFGTLQVTPRVCNTRPQTEAPQTTSFVEVDETMVKSEATRDAKGNAPRDPKNDKPEAKRIFSGWMFAASPGLHGVEHPVYDVWLTDCKGGKEVAVAPPPAPEAAPDAAAPDANAAADSKKRSKRSRRVEPETPPPAETQPATGGADQPALEPNAAPAAAAAPAPGPEGATAPPTPKKKKKPRQPPADAAPASAPNSSPFPF